jgi:hypothetical protein
MPTSRISNTHRSARRPRPSMLLRAAMAVFLAVAASACTRSSQEATALDGNFFSPDGIAIGGYDPVAYFTEGRPVKGAPSLAAQHQEATFWFASAANRDRFLADPRRYAPQYGGFCAYGVAEGYRATTEPDAFTLHEGRLYLNYNTDVRTLWTKDRDRRIARANEHWRNGVR